MRAKIWKALLRALALLVFLAGTGVPAYADSPSEATPFASPCYALVSSWGVTGHEAAQFNYPIGVAVDPSGSIFVSDSLNFRVQKFDPAGKFLTQWGGSGPGDGMFGTDPVGYYFFTYYGPKGIAVDVARNVYVVDSNNNRVEKFDAQGTYLSQWGQTGSGDGEFERPGGIAVDGFGNIYVGDELNNRVQKFDESGQYLGQWGGPGAGPGQFEGTMAIAADRIGDVYVVDSSNNRVEKFDASGHFITQWGGAGSNSGQFAGPTAIAVGRDGNVYVADGFNARIQKFDPSGTFLAQWGSYGSQDGQLDFPRALAVDRDGNVYVADAGNDRIAVYRPVPASTSSN